MILKSLHIISFGGLRNRDIDLSRGVNVIDGANESGKSSAAMFIKFIFYGLSSRATKAGASERQRYINRDTNQASGFIIAQTAHGQQYRLERTLIASDDGPLRERIRIINQETGETVSGQNPGEYFFGVPEEVFTGTCFVAQADAVKPAITGIGKSSGSSKGAVENLLTSADENVDIARAVKKLDNERRELLYKNGNGGEIAELKKKRAAFAEEMASSAEQAAEIINTSSSLEDIKQRISELEETKQKYDNIFSALDKITVKRRIDAADQTRERIARLKTAVNAIDDSPLGNGFEDTLLEAERDIYEYDEECIAYDEKLPELSVPAEDVPDFEETVDHIYRASFSARLMTGLCFGMLIPLLLAAGMFAFLYFMNIDALLIPVGVAAISIVFWVVFLILATKKRHYLRRLFAEWEIDSPDDIELAVQDKIDHIAASNSAAIEKERMDESLAAAKLRFDAAESNIYNLAEAANIEPSDDIYETIDALKQVCENTKIERDELTAKIENLSGRLEVLNEQLDGIDIASAELEAHTALASEYGTFAAGLDNAGIKNTIKEREFTEGALRSAQKRCSALEEKLLSLGKLSHTPDQLATLIDAADRRIEELTLRHDACELARSALIKAGESMRSGVIPKISEAASQIISGATGKYNRLIIDGTFTCGLSSDTDTVTSEYLSHGTGDLAYVALRIALADEVFRTEKPTIIFDESFAHIDGTRIKNVMRMLSMRESEHQYIVFTCRADETNAARTLGCNTIQL